MRKVVAFLLTAIMVLSLSGMTVSAASNGAMTVISCEEQDFSTQVDFSCETEWVDGDGLYIYTEEKGYIPYILIWVNQSSSRVMDGDAYIENVLKPKYQENYSKNGAMQMTQHGSFTVGGRNVSALDTEYRNSQGYKIYFLTVYDVRDTFTVSYRVRYTDPSERDGMLSALDTVAENLQLGANYYTGGSSAPQTQQIPQSPSNTSEALSYTVTDMAYGYTVLGRVVAPTGYSVQYQPFCSMGNQSAGNPWFLAASATSPDQTIALSYGSSRDFIASAEGETPDGQFHSQFMTPMLHYMTASEYCDYIVLQNHSKNASLINLVDENTYPDKKAVLQEKAQQTWQEQSNLLQGTSLSCENVSYTAATRTYYLETTTGLQYYYVVAACTIGQWYRIYIPGPYVDINESYIMWGVPAVYTMLCPAYEWEENKDIFTVFMENTTVSDQFMLANQKLSTRIWDIMTGRDPLAPAEDYDRILQDTTSTGDDYMMENFPDIIIDHYNYTLPSQKPVRISKEYGNVYSDGGATIYVNSEDSGFPAGAVRLNPY